MRTICLHIRNVSKISEIITFREKQWGPFGDDETPGDSIWRDSLAWCTRLEKILATSMTMITDKSEYKPGDAFERPIPLKRPLHDERAGVNKFA